MPRRERTPEQVEERARLAAEAAEEERTRVELLNERSAKLRAQRLANRLPDIEGAAVVQKRPVRKARLIRS